MNAPSATIRAESTRPDTRAETTHEGVKDTLESIIVAFVLAFVFRAFVIEAFVIPTGSMAATLLGKHGTITCKDCGYEFDYGLTDLSTPGPTVEERQGQYGPNSRAVCPNCRYENTQLRVNDRAKNAEAGDRILVLKWPWEIDRASLGAKRWDVTVFKDPSDGTTNFIKRMAGLPHEVLMIVDGDVYAVPEASLSPQSLETFQYYRQVKQLLQANSIGFKDRPAEERERYNRLTPQERVLFDHPMPEAVLRELERKLTIQRKTDEAQDSLWFIVYDHDYPPVDWHEGQPAWMPLNRAESGWNADPKEERVQERRVRFNGIGKPRQGLAFSAGASAGGPINDAYAYNLAGVSRNPVADLRLSFVLAPQGGEGSLWLKLSKRGNAFWARLQRDGHVSLTRTDGREPDGVDALANGRVRPFNDGDKRRIVFEDVDYRVRLYVDDQVVLETTPQQYSPDLHAIRAESMRASETPRIFAENLQLELWHLMLQRDVYYSRAQDGQGFARLPWGIDGNPILLADGEYFMLGDNSPQSQDSRLWARIGPHLRNRENYQLGTVPRDQLIGRAFFVYWPSGLRIPWLPILRDYGIIPNVGRMRWIR
ncbi:MAG TPA: S26 family signal peptidase [Phycisphaerae bacterium]